MKKALLCTALLIGAKWAFAQDLANKFDLGTISGNFQADAQYYLEDTLIDPLGEAYPDERLLATGFLNLTYRRGDFSAGIRYESYQNNRVGLPPGYQGEGIAYRYARFAREKYDITVGNFYEQFGSGLTLRAFEERGLGLDNNLDGLRVIFMPTDGVTIKGLVGRQRNYFEKSEGIVRGADVEWNLKNTLNWKSNTNFLLGGSFVSKFQAADDPIYTFPQNVAAGAVRASLITSTLNISGEFAYKANDPTLDNGFIYKDGSALYLTGTYAKNNLGVSLGVKRYDNFSFRSQRVTDPQQLLINFLPSLTTLHTYALPALYSFNTIAVGEQGLQADVSYNFKRETLFGGKYGTQITVSYAISQSLDKEYVDENGDRIDRPVYNPIDTSIVGYTDDGTDGYQSNVFGFGDITYFQDFHVEVKKKLSKKWKGTFTYYNFLFNNDYMRKGANDYDITMNNVETEVYRINAGVIELLYKIKPRHSLRAEIQGLFMGTDKSGVKQDRGDWALVLLEYSIAPHWFIAFQDAYNYGNPDEDLQVHYLNANIGYTIGTTRLQLGYGRQQAGVFCVGGICRIVPASNGFTLGITSNF